MLRSLVESLNDFESPGLGDLVKWQRPHAETPKLKQEWTLFRVIGAKWHPNHLDSYQLSPVT